MSQFAEDAAPVDDSTEQLVPEQLVSQWLSERSAVEMPDAVAERIERAIAAEAATRDAGAALESTKRSYLELETRSDLGTFGKNAPTRYDRNGIGISEQSPST
ncbi:hypothetical protein ACQCX5_05490 [Propionibacteriaceae bacterium G57]|uniref:hypothetical protein n=1 Tax=Aestuariimicrobium sp. G57 TaxID=3418485 RepID=UPI003DA6F780